MQKIAVVILHYGSSKDTVECLLSLDKILLSKNTSLEIVVVDNGSKPEFRIQNSEFRIERIKIIRNEENLGFAEGNNVGIRYGLGNGADYVLVLNNDTIVDKNLVRELLKVLKDDKEAGIVAPKIYFARGFEFHKNRYSKNELGKIIWYAGGEMDWRNVIGHHRGVDEVDRGQYNKIEETVFASGCCMMVKKEVFDRIGLFDGKYFLYYEDADLSKRTKKAGYKIIYAPKAVIWHKNAGSAGGSGSTLQDYYITRNRLLFGFRYALVRSKIALVRESILTLIKGRYWQKRAVLDFYLNRFEKGLYPI